MPSSLESVGAGHSANKLGSPTRSGVVSAALNKSTPPIAAQVDNKKLQPQQQPWLVNDTFGLLLSSELFFWPTGQAAIASWEVISPPPPPDCLVSLRPPPLCWVTSLRSLEGLPHPHLEPSLHSLGAAWLPAGPGRHSRRSRRHQALRRQTQRRHQVGI